MAVLQSVDRWAFSLCHSSMASAWIVLKSDMLYIRVLSLESILPSFSHPPSPLTSISRAAKLTSREMNSFVWNPQRSRQNAKETPTKSTRDGLTSSYSDSSKSLHLEKTDCAEKRKQLLASMKSGRIDHPSLFEQLFDESLILSKAAFDKINEGSSLWSKGRWVDMPVNPKKESEVQEGFLKIVKKILPLIPADCHDTATRILDTHAKRIQDDHGGSFLQPDIFAKGNGPLFPVADPTLSAPPWATCLNASEMKVEITTKNSYSQLGTYVEQIFATQDNRRYVECFCLDWQKFVFYVFDRAGSCSSAPVDYHRDPWKLMALIRNILMIGERDEVDAGLDHSIFHEHGKTYIRTPTAKYVISKTLSRSTDIRGPGTVFWLANLHSDATLARLIKDSWVKKGCQREKEIYRLAGEMPGIAKLSFSYNVMIGQTLDCIFENRPELPEGIVVDNLVHTRSVYYSYPGSKTSERFTNEEELLLAFYDAIKGHQRLYGQGILHNRITPNRLIIQPNAPPSQRGVLFDLSSAILLGNAAAAIALAPPEPMINRVFAPRNALKSERLKRDPHCIDDLESFLFVFCYLTNGYDAYGTDLKVLASSMDESSTFAWPLFMDEWFDDRGGSHQKENLLRQLKICPYTVHESFSPSIQILVERWQRFFANIERAKTTSGNDQSVPDGDIAYEEILLYIEDALKSVRFHIDPQTGGKRREKGVVPAFGKKRKKSST